MWAFFIHATRQTLNKRCENVAIIQVTPRIITRRPRSLARILRDNKRELRKMMIASSSSMEIFQPRKEIPRGTSMANSKKKTKKDKKKKKVTRTEIHVHREADPIYWWTTDS